MGEQMLTTKSCIDINIYINLKLLYLVHFYFRHESETLKLSLFVNQNKNIVLTNNLRAEIINVCCY